MCFPSHPRSPLSLPPHVCFAPLVSQCNSTVPTFVRPQTAAKRRDDALNQINCHGKEIRNKSAWHMAGGLSHVVVVEQLLLSGGCRRHHRKKPDEVVCTQEMDPSAHFTHIVSGTSLSGTALLCCGWNGARQKKTVKRQLLFCLPAPARASKTVQPSSSRKNGKWKGQKEISEEMLKTGEMGHRRQDIHCQSLGATPWLSNAGRVCLWGRGAGEPYQNVRHRTASTKAPNSSHNH